MKNIFSIAIIFLSACSSKTFVGTYYLAPQPFMTSSIFMTIYKNKKFEYHDVSENNIVSGYWDINKDTLRLYSSNFKHTQYPIIKDIGYYYASFKDSSEAVLQYVLDRTPIQPNQLTFNDSVDIFIVEKSRLFPLNPISSVAKGIIESNYWKKILDSTEYRYQLKKAKFER